MLNVPDVATADTPVPTVAMVQGMAPDELRAWWGGMDIEQRAKLPKDVFKYGLDAFLNLPYSKFITQRLATRQGIKAAAPLPIIKNVQPLPLQDFLKREFKPRETLLAPWLQTQSLSMIYGPRGIGKTRFTSSIVFAAASGGSAFGWKAARKIQVTHLDGEMAGADLQDMFAGLYVAAGNAWDGSTLRVVTPDACDGIPDLATTAGQIAIENVLGDTELLVIDNLSAWVRGTGEENSAESWLPMLDWLLRMRSQGRSVLLVHHAGKGGQQRGTSKREDALDTVIALRRCPQHTAEDGARFEVHFEKARGLHGKAVAPFEAQLTMDARGCPTWATRTIEESHTAQILALEADGLTQADIARELGINRSTVSRALKRMQQNGGDFRGGMQQPKKGNSYATHKG